MPSMPRWRARSRCRWSSRISTAPAAKCRSSAVEREGAARARALRAGNGAGQGDDRRVSRARPASSCRGPGLLPATVPGRVRCLDAAAARLRHAAAARGARARDPLRGERLSGRAAHLAGDRRGRAAVPRALAELGRGVRPGAQAGDVFLRTRKWRRPIAASCAKPRPQHRPRAADREGARCLVPRLRRRGDRPLLPRGNHGLQRPAGTAGLLTADDMAHWQATYEEPLARDYRGYTVLKCGPLEPGPRPAAAARARRAPRPRAPRPARRRVRAPRRGEREAVLRRPRRLARRSGVRRRAGQGAPVQGLCRASAPRMVADRANTDFRPGSPAARKPKLPGFAAESARLAKSASSSLGIGEPTFAAARRGRHLPPGRHRPLGQRGLRHALGWLAVVEPGRAGARLLREHPAADQLAGRVAPRRARARQAALDHALAEPRAARRRALPLLRHARRRPAGPVAGDLLPAPRAPPA